MGSYIAFCKHANSETLFQLSMLFTMSPTAVFIVWEPIASSSEVFMQSLDHDQLAASTDK